MFKDKVLLITGGTGSFGNTVLKRFLDTDVKEIRIFSRDEKKQEEMRISLNRMTRQQLEAEQYRLTQQAKTDTSFEVQKRLSDVAEELADIADERKRLLGPGN